MYNEIGKLFMINERKNKLTLTALSVIINLHY